MLFLSIFLFFFFFFNDTATTEIYTLSLHDALPISPWQAPRSSSRVRVCHASATGPCQRRGRADPPATRPVPVAGPPDTGDRKSTRLNSSHLVISYAVFCLKKKKYNIIKS